jgi:hypothetical protein
MTPEELENDPTCKVYGSGSDLIPFEPLVVGPVTWRCKECHIWVAGTPRAGGKCKYCTNYEIEKERLMNQSVERTGEMPPHIFHRLNEEGRVVFSMISDDGRVVDLD